jgi:Flp pilus assembly protein TadG
MRRKKSSEVFLCPETGSASLEFISAGMILIVPFVYLVLVVAQLQGAQLAVEGAARSAARLYVQSDTIDAANNNTQRSIQFALENYGFGDAPRQMSVSCAPVVDNCFTRGSTVKITVRVDIQLPFVPDVVFLNHVAVVPVIGSARQPISKFAPVQP